jgi:hypothetical protein
MSLASLTIDLTANLSKFEGDMGKAAGIVTRESQKMEAAQAAFLRSLQRTAERAGKSQAEFLALKAAQLGVSAAAEKYINVIAATTDAQHASVNSQKAGFAELVASINQVSQAASKRRAELIADEKAGKITPDQLKGSLQGLSAKREQAVEQLKLEAQLQASVAATAEAESQAAAKRIAAFQRLRQTVSELGDKQTYRAEQERAAAAQKAADAERASNQAFVAARQREADAIGKTRVQLLAEEAARRGVTAQVAPFIAKLAEAEQNINKFGRTTGITQYELQTLSYTFSDVVASLASGISPMTILLQQGGQVRDVFGSFGNVFRGIASIITPARLAIGGTAATVGVLSYAFYEGSRQSKAFADAMVLTGGFAGQTEGSFNRVARGVAEAGRVTESSAREFAQALVATGEVGPEVFEKAATAAAEYGKATGKTASEVAQDFASMSRGVTQWATEHNRQLHILSAAQLEQIRRLEEQGKAADAQGIVYDALNARLPKLAANLGTIEKTLQIGANAWSRFWNAALDIGREDTIDDRIEKLNRRIAASKANGGVPFSGATAGGNFRTSSQTAEDENERNLLLRQRGLEIAAKAAAADDAAAQTRAVDARAFVDGYEKRAKSVTALNRALAEANSKFEALARVGTPVSAKAQAEIIAQIRQEFVNSETQQTRKAALDASLKVLELNLQEERSALEFQNSYVKAIYEAGTVSLKTFYDQKNAAEAAGVRSELETLSRERSELQKYLSGTTDRSEVQATKGRIAEIDERAAKIRADSARKTILSNVEEAASFRALGNQVTDFQAQILSLQGDEFGAAQKRAQTSVANARILAGQAGSGVDPAAFERATAAANVFTESQRLAGVVSANAAREEELFLLKAEQRGASLAEQEEGVRSIRQAALEQLRTLTEQTVKLAEVSSDPRLKAFAADLVVQYEKAADQVDPLINRLRDSGKSLASDISTDVGEALVDFNKLKDLGPQILRDIQKISDQGAGHGAAAEVAERLLQRVAARSWQDRYRRSAGGTGVGHDHADDGHDGHGDRGRDTRVCCCAGGRRARRGERVQRRRRARFLPVSECVRRLERCRLRHRYGLRLRGHRPVPGRRDEPRAVRRHARGAPQGRGGGAREVQPGRRRSSAWPRPHVQLR